MTFDIRKVKLDKLNSLTKYPSIPTYHELGEKGKFRVHSNVNHTAVEFNGTAYITEKIDGTNARIIVCPDGSVVVGSREELLWHVGDLIHNPSMGIVDVLKRKAQDIAEFGYASEDQTTVYYVEVYGHNIGSGAKNYTKTGKTDYRLFDIAKINKTMGMLDLGREDISRWREGGGQPYLDMPQMLATADYVSIPTVPWYGVEHAEDVLPKSIEDTFDYFFKGGIPAATKCALDVDAIHLAEGVVIRSPDRRQIAKIRFEDYARNRRSKPTKEGS